MPVQLPENTINLTVDELRMFLRDQPDYNILLDDIEFTDDDIRLAMKLTVAKWNSVTPVTNVTDPAQLNEYILLCGVCGFLFKSEGIRQMRNQLITQDGNISPVGIDEKEAIYLKWADHFQREFMDKAQAIKVQNNIESLLDPCSNGLSSGYRYIGRWSI